MSSPKKYHRLVGQLIYLTINSPEFAYSFHVLAQFRTKLRQEHRDATLLVVRYLKSSLGQGIFLSAS